MPVRILGMEELKEEFRQRRDKLVRALLLEALRRLVMKTPVRFGRARGNWNVSIGAYDESHDVDRFDKDGSSTISRGMTVIADFEAGDKGYVTNSLPYIPALEDGHSQQAPEGMIAVTVAELQPLVHEIAAQIRAGGDAQ